MTKPDFAKKELLTLYLSVIKISRNENMQLPFLTIRESLHKGKGVFTNEAITANTLIEIAPVIICPAADIPLIDKTNLYNYYFKWGNLQTEIAIALGYGSMYNHSYTPNVAYKMDYEQQTISFVAWEYIAAETELFINFNGEVLDTTPVWFDV